MPMNVFHSSMGNTCGRLHPGLAWHYIKPSIQHSDWQHDYLIFCLITMCNRSLIRVIVIYELRSFKFYPFDFTAEFYLQAIKPQYTDQISCRDTTPGIWSYYVTDLQGRNTFLITNLTALVHGISKPMTV